LAYDKGNLYRELLNLASNRDEQIFSLEQLCAIHGISKKTFYNLFSKDSEESATIRECLMDNRVFIKRKLQKKWYESNNFTAQIALYKLLADEEERAILSDRPVIPAETRPVKIELSYDSNKLQHVKD
jgi:hypothetical protein